MFLATPFGPGETLGLGGRREDIEKSDKQMEKEKEAGWLGMRRGPVVESINAIEKKQ